MLFESAALLINRVQTVDVRDVAFVAPLRTSRPTLSARLAHAGDDSHRHYMAISPVLACWEPSYGPWVTLTGLELGQGLEGDTQLKENFVPGTKNDLTFSIYLFRVN